MKHSRSLHGIDMELRHPLMHSSAHAMVISGILLLISCWPLLVTSAGWPFSYILPSIISLPLASAFVVGCIVGLLRRGWNYRVFIAMILSGLAVAARVGSLLLRFQHLAHDAA